MNKGLLTLLQEEVKPAMGCTEPVAVTLAAAKAREVGSHIAIDYMNVTVSPNIFKNGMAVGIPKSEDVGILKAAAIGAIEGDSNLGLKIFESIGDVNHLADQLITSNRIRLHIADTDEKILINIQMISDGGETEVIIKGKHNHFAYIVHNGEVLHESEVMATEQGFNIQSMSLEEIIDAVEKADPDSLEFLMEGLEMNAAVAQCGLEEKLGIGVGYNAHQLVKNKLLGDDLANKAMYFTAAASDARMSGISLPVMSSNGSGNNGLTAILPIYAYLEDHEVSLEQTVKALAISHLINCYIKSEIGRLSALCSCGISAATGSAVAITWLMGGSRASMHGTIQNMIANVSGMICDGAKDSCALKLATAASIGVKSALWSLNGTISQAHDGIVHHSAEESIKNLGTLSREGMKLTDSTILNIMKDML